MLSKEQTSFIAITAGRPKCRLEFTKYLNFGFVKESKEAQNTKYVEFRNIGSKKGAVRLI